MDNVRVSGLASMGQFMKMEEALMVENEELINKLGLLELDESDNRF